MENKHPLQRSLLISIAVFLAVVLVVAGCKIKTPKQATTIETETELETAETETELEEVNFQLNWIWNSTHKVLMPGVYRGFFAEEGIKVNFLPGSGSSVAIKSVAMEKAEFGFASAAELLIARSKAETPVKMLGCLNQRGMTALFFPKSLNIKTAKDFEGKNIAGNPKSLKTEAAKIYLKINGADLDKVEIVGVPKGQGLKYLMMGKVDSSVFAYVSGKTQLKLQDKSDEFDSIFLEDHGVTLMDISIVVNEKVLREKPDLAKRFMRALMKSWRYASTYPEETNEMLHKHIPTISMEFLEAEAENAFFLNWSEETSGRPLGWISAERLEKTQETLINADRIKERMNLEEIYTNEYIY